MWDTKDNAKVFLASAALYYDQRRDEVGSAVFDKDDILAVEFVTAASNLRSAGYGIPTQTLFDAKGMAGNIIHAIATTNAMISGQIVLEAMKVLAGKPEATRWTFLFENASSKRLSATSVGDEPVVLKKRLSMNTPTLMCGDFMYEEGEGLDEDEIASYSAMLTKPLNKLPGGGLVHGSIVTVSDDSQRFSLELIFSHKDDFDPKEVPEGFTLQGKMPVAEAEPEASEKKAEESDDDGDFVMEDDGDVVVAEDDGKGNAGEKRKRVDGDDEIILVEESVETKAPKI
eukprot:gene25935-11613_t